MLDYYTEVVKNDLISSRFMMKYLKLYDCYSLQKVQ